MQPFVNPNYFSYPQFQQPMQQNPYMDRLAQLQSQQQIQSTNQFSAIGKIVESMDIVKATDIPMDGSMYYFPTADGSAIFGKQWLASGTTRILTFKPVLNDSMVNSSAEQEKLKYEDVRTVLDGIQNDIQALNEKIDKIAKPTASKTKKEGSADE